MSVWGWVAIGIVVLALFLFAAVALGTVRRLKTLQRVVDGNAAAMAMDAQALQSKVVGLQTGIAEMQQRVQMTQERIAHVKG